MAPNSSEEWFTASKLEALKETSKNLLLLLSASPLVALFKEHQLKSEGAGGPKVLAGPTVFLFAKLSSIFPFGHETLLPLVGWLQNLN